MAILRNSYVALLRTTPGSDDADSGPIRLVPTDGDPTEDSAQRIFGFWFDRIGIDFDPNLALRARSGQAASRLTAGSRNYDSKWHLYYDSRIVDRYVPA